MLESLGALDEADINCREHLVVCPACRRYAIGLREMKELSVSPSSAESDEARCNRVLAAFCRVLDAQLEECEAWQERDVIHSQLIN